LRRHSTEAQAEKASVLAANPEFQRLFAETRDELLRELEGFALDGTEARDRAALEVVRQLQVLLKMRKTLMRPIARLRVEQASAERRKTS
jgi:hypothetical protein